MNKKVLVAVLGVVVLFVWYKVIASFFGANIEEQPFQPNQAYANIDLSNLVSSDSIPTLELNYRDPFLGEVNFPNPPNKTSVKNNTTPSRKKENKNMASLNWPSISYHGFVKVHGNKHSMVILKINNQLVQIGEGELYESILQVKKAYRDSILLEMNGEQKVFFK